MKVTLSDYAIGFTCKFFGSRWWHITNRYWLFGDAIVQGLMLRDRDNVTYQNMIRRLNHNLPLSAELDLAPL